MKVAVIGSGISGLSSAYFLSKKYKVDLYEKEDHFGGHSFTYDIKEGDKIVPVDLGFIVFNKTTYPNLVKFFNELNVPYGANVNVSEGDKILFGKWSGTEVTIDGEELLIMKESDILGILS